jgi:hypothetical protein
MQAPTMAILLPVDITYLRGYSVITRTESILKMLEKAWLVPYKRGEQVLATLPNI